MEQHNTQVPESVTSGMGEGRSLHAAIMNLPADKKVLAQMEGPPKGFYLLGHQAARHAAAELALRSDAINAELLEALTLMCRSRGSIDPIPHEDHYAKAYAAIKKATA